MKIIELDFLDSKTAKFIEELNAKGGPPIYKLPVNDARNVLKSLQADSVGKIPALIEDKMIPGGPKGKISIRIVRPLTYTGKLPVVMYFHGGGWILGDKDTHDYLIRDIATGAQVAVVFVNYTPSPEAAYPIGVEEAYAATKFIAEQGDSLNLDTTSLVVIGDSVGGNMATVVAMLAKERGGPKIDYQILLYPVTDSGLDTPSYEQFAEGPWLTKAAMEWFWNAYEPNVEARKKPTLSPLRASIEQLRGMPTTLLITDENDVLRDEGEAYAHKLMKAGVDVTAMRYLGTHHDFLMLSPLIHTPAAKNALTLVKTKLHKWLMRIRSSD